MRNVLNLLKMLTDRYPPLKGCKHSLTLLDADRLLVSVHLGDIWQNVTIDEGDLDRPVGDIFNDIAMLVDRLKEYGALEKPEHTFTIRFSAD